MSRVDDLIPTRQSLLSRLRDLNDQESWAVFFETYWRLIYKTAIRAGLTETEAQDVVQETVFSLSKNMPSFKYDPSQGSFKGWLLRLTRWRILDQFRKRQRGIAHPGRARDTDTGTATVERIVDPAGPALEAVWDWEWEKNLMAAATERVKRKVDPKQYQLFDLYVIQQWPVERVAKALRVSRARVYLAKHRIGKLLKEEIRYLQTRPFECG